MLFVNSTELIVLLAVCAIAAACFVAAMILLFIAIHNQRRAQSPTRKLLEIKANYEKVKVEFSFGEEFNCKDLIVDAIYNLKPKKETISQFDVLTEEEYTHLADLGGINGLYVIKPNMEEDGKKMVIIRYKDKVTYYPINVLKGEEMKDEEVKDEPKDEEVKEHEDVEDIESFDSVLHYNKSFMAKYIQSSDEIKNWYTKLKNELLSYKKVKARMSFKRETFHLGREVVARFSFRGNTLCVYLPLNPNDYAESKYKVEDVSDITSFADTPCMYRLKNEKRVRYALNLLAIVLEKMNGIRMDNYVTKDYYLPYEGMMELINKGLIKRVIKKKEDEPDFLKEDSKEKTPIEEDNTLDEKEVTPSENEEDNLPLDDEESSDKKKE